MSSGVKGLLTDIDKKLDLLIQSHEAYTQTVNKHEMALYGKEGTESIGLVRKVDGIGNRLDYIQRFALAIWAAIFAVIQGAISVIAYFRHKV